MAAAGRYRRVAKAARSAPLSGRRRRPRSWRRPALPCPGRAAPASARGRARGLRRSRFQHERLAPGAASRCRRRRGRRGWGRCARRTSSPASVWQTAHERANSSRPFCCSAVRCTPPTATLALWLALNASTIAGTARPNANSTTMPSVTSRCPRLLRCAAPAARRAGRRASRRRRRRGRAGPRRSRTAMSMPAGRYRVAAQNGRRARRGAPRLGVFRASRRPSRAW